MRSATRPDVRCWSLVARPPDPPDVFRRVTFLFFVFVFVFIVGIPILDTPPNQSKEQGTRNRGSAYGTWVGGPEL